MRWLVCCFLIIQAVWHAECAPAEETAPPDMPVVVTGDEKPSEEKPDCKDAVTDVYDQRQNGSENIRLHLKGVGIVISFAPEAGDAVIQNLVAEQNNMNNEDTVSLKPPNQEGAPLPIEGGLRERGRYKWGNLLQILKHLKPSASN